ncbi:membrane-bound alkaline phosphatase-like [Phlebotomus argentipes]|uniref:membrane-bound alkaline phosphatase-like n=1 Tax=Phlebotomus argentipes TaxID=94469 RepID=UPI002892A8DF|nr:membrane-bound alkaline phosphatase-like [Phlebotomus argentipes]
MKWIKSLCFVALTLACFQANAENCGSNRSKRLNAEEQLHHAPQASLSHSSGYPWEQNSDYWIKLGQKHVVEKVSQKLNKNRAKNVVFFMGDGMSVATQFATRVALGGEEHQLSFEKFPYAGLLKTYCVDSQVGDSACTGTAYMCGVKANYQTLGVDAQVNYEDCVAGLNTATHTESITQWALNAGKSVGIVTTTRVTHASPAASYAHTSNRHWENDYEIRRSGCDPKKIKDIAQQLIHGPTGSRYSVILGGGRGEFRDSTMADEEGGFGYRNDSRDLISEWLNSGTAKKKYVWNRQGLMSLPSDTEKVLGLFEQSHMQYYLESQEKGSQKSEPTLAEMTKKAIEILEKNKKGFFLFVEGGKIDLAHHDLMSRAAIWETIEMHNAVKLARDMLSDEDTLFVVTADHAHTMTVSGYPTRGNDIFGEVDREIATDGMPYMTLSYANGLKSSKQYSAYGRVNPATSDFSRWNSNFPFYVPIKEEESHGGEDVTVHACGPYAHLFTGTMEQSFIPHLIAYAAGIGHGPKSP